MNKYELIVVLRSSGKTDSLVDKIKDILKKYGVEIESEDPWGVKKLAYEIDNENEGYYLYLIVQSPPDAIKKISKEFHLIADVLRYLAIKLKKSEIKESEVKES